ncbi:MAG: BlaI/MecI/CopY family transcriptional regulator [Pirellulales bacterium]
MAPSQSDVTEAELAVLEILWERGIATVRQIAEAIYPQITSSEHATVQKLLDRLKAKNCVDRDRSVWPHQFTALVQREQLIGRRLEGMAERLCGGSLQPLLTHLVRNTKLSSQERRSLRALLDELDQEQTPTRRSKRA